MVKVANRWLAVLLIALLAAGTVVAKKPRKLPRKAYIQSAKIEILSSDTVRMHTAIAMLDSLVMNYGPDPEAYYWMTKILVDFSEKRPGLADKQATYRAMRLYTDSLEWACDKKNKEVDKKSKEHCDEFVPEVDSSNVQLWRVNFNDAIERINSMDDLLEASRSAPDSATQASYQADLRSVADTAKAIMERCLIIDSTDPRAYRGMASIFEKLEQYDSSAVYLKRAVPFAEDILNNYQGIAYDYIKMNDFCEAAVWFRKYVDTALNMKGILDNPQNLEAITSNMNNLSICYNNCKMYDSAYQNYVRLLQIDSTSPEALSGIGHYENQMALEASDSANAYQKLGKEDMVKKWRDERGARFDSAVVYLGKAVQYKPDDAKLLGEWALLLVVREHYEEGREAFQKLIDLEPNNAEAWTSLGDCDINLHDFEDAAKAYEKVIELEPNNKRVLERLRDLYESPELRNPTREAEVNKMLENLE